MKSLKSLSHLKSSIITMKHTVIIIFALIGTITVTAQPIKHPSLLFTPERITLAKQRIQADPAFAQAWKQIKQAAEAQLNSNNIVGIEKLAFAYTMTDDSRYAKKIKDILLSTSKEKAWTEHEQFQRVPAWRSELGIADRAYHMALGYDAIYNYLSPKERKQIVDAAYRLAIEPLIGDWVSGTTRIHSFDSMGHNWWAVCACNGAILALAMSNESEEARKGAEAVIEALPEWFDFAGNELQPKPKNFDNVAGGLYESVSYSNYGVSSPLLLRLVWQNAHPEIPKEEIPQIDKLTNFFCHIAYPSSGNFRSVNFGDHDIDSTGKQALVLANALGKQTPELLWYLSQMSPEQHAVAHSYSLNTPIGLLYAIDISNAPSTPNLPKSQIWPDFGWATMRNSWDKNATMLAVKSGITWNHAHADANSFILYHKGIDILKDAGKCGYGEPEYRDYFFQSDAHNVVKFNGQGQPREQQDFASMLSGYLNYMLDGDNIKYVLANGTGPTSDMFSRNYRHFLWTDNMIYIIDDIKSHQPGHFEWLWHPGGEANIQGQDMTVTNGNSSVVVRPLFPRMLIPADSVRESLYWEEFEAPTHMLKSTENYYSFHLPTKTNKVMSMTAIILKDDVNQRELPSIERRQGENWMGVRVTNKGKVTDVYLNQLADGRRMDQPTMIEPDGWKTDAYMLVVSYPEDSDPALSKEMFLCHGSFLHRNNDMYFSSLPKLNVIVHNKDGKIDLQVSGQPHVNFGIKVPEASSLKVNGRPIPLKINEGLVKVKYKE